VARALEVTRLARENRDLRADVADDTCAAATAPGGPGLQAFLDGAAAERIRVVLAEVGGRRVEAARRLGIDRTTLYRLMRKHAIEE